MAKQANEQLIEVPHEGRQDIPCSVWSTTDEPAFVVLMGHGLGVDRHHESVLRPVEVLTRDHRAVVVAPEIPLHGVRSEHPSKPSDVVELWHVYWSSGGANEIGREFLHLAAFCNRSFASLPLVYFGLSLGTQYGIVFLSKARQIRAAVLGLFGSYPAPKTPVMNRHAPEVTCPVYFVQKLDDEIHPAESTSHLFSTLGAAEKRLDSSRGGHTAVSAETLRNACRFLASHASTGGSTGMS